MLSLLDNFQIQGPNGTHEVFVTEVVASLRDFLRYPLYKNVRPNETHICLTYAYLVHLSRQFRKIFIHQAFLGVSYLHSRGIAHGGKHIILLHLSLERALKII